MLSSSNLGVLVLVLNFQYAFAICNLSLVSGDICFNIEHRTDERSVLSILLKDEFIEKYF